MTLRRRVLIIYNPAAGMRAQRRLTRVHRHLLALGAEVSMRQTARRGDAEMFAADASPTTFDVIVAAGGDGTINEVANGLGSPALPLAVIPLGTANVVAAEINMPAKPDAIARTIVDGAARTVSLGLANERRFVMMAGVGFDAYVVAHVDPRSKRLFGRLS